MMNSHCATLGKHINLAWTLLKKDVPSSWKPNNIIIMPTAA